MSISKLSDIVADIRTDPVSLGHDMAYQEAVVQERFMDMFFGFVMELAAQDQRGAYVNGNMETAAKGNLIDYLLHSYSIL